MTHTPERYRRIEDLGPGDHLCCIYETDSQHRAVLTPFLRQGLERHQKVVYIVDARTAETVLGYLRDDGVDVEPYLTSGQLAILTRDDAYLRTGVFDPDGMIALLRAETDKALSEGYSALRATGEMTWALRGLPGSERLIEYESKLNEFFPTAKALAICQYDRRRFAPEILLDVLHTHPIVMIGTEVHRNFYYLPPNVFLGDLPEGRLQQWTRALADHGRDEDRVRSLNRLLRTINEINQLIVHEKDRNRLLAGVCRIAVEHGGFPMAWVGLTDRPGGAVTPVASAGVGREYADEIEVDLDPAHGPLRPAARAVVEDRTVAVADTESDPGFAPWRESARARGFRSCAAFPVRTEGVPAGVLKVYSASPDVFQGEEVVVLEELAADLGYALGALATDAARRESEARYRSLFEHSPIPHWEEDFSAVRTRLDDLSRQGVTDLRAYFEAHAEELPKCAALVRIVDVNQASVRYFAAADKAEVCRRLQDFFVAGSWPVFREELAYLHGGETFFRSEIPIRTVPGDTRVVDLTLSVAPGFEKTWSRVLVSWLDVTERKQTEEALWKSSELLERLFATTEFMLAYLDRDMYFIRVNRAYAHADGRTPDFYVGKNHFDLFPDPDNERIFRRVVETGEPYFVYAKPFSYAEHPERGVTYWNWSLLPVREAGGTVAGLVLSLVDVTDQLRAQEAVRRSEERYRSLFERNVAGVFRSTLDGRILECNEAFARMFGFESPAEAMSRPAVERFPEPQARDAFIATLREHGTLENVERQMCRKDGSPLWVIQSVSLVPDEKGEPTVFEGTILDITERQRDEAVRQAASAYARNLIEASLDPLVTISPRGTITDVNEATELATGVPRERLIGSDFSSYFTAPDKAREGYEKVLTEGTVRDYPLTIRHVAGGTMDVLYNATVYRDGTGAVQGVFAAARDITERKRAEEERRHLAEAVEQAAETIVITNPDATIEYVNPAFTRVTGYTRAEALGQNPRILKSGRQDGSFYKQMWDTLERGEVWHGHLINKRKDGTYFEEDATISPVRDETGATGHFVAVKRDVSQEVALEAQLRQSQKLEAIGTLAGGVAHDFNNILQAMLSNTQVLRSHPHDAARVATIGEELEQQVRRGAALTRQLLLFSRHETARPEPLDLNRVARETMGMLRRLVRENIAFALECAPRPLPVVADRGQLEQVMMNLVVNAADSMPDGGKITIRTGADSPNSVWLAVGDTGSGISDGIRERIFEPFFTTKHPGKGTGLGLSVVHGIVSRHGGRIELTSSVGRGSTFRVLLPRATAAAPAPSRPATAETELDIPNGRGERVLVVEDEEAARSGLKEILETLRYTVTVAGSAEEARGLAVDQPYEALLSDLMLPGASGAELAGGLRQRWPNMQVILMSGYTEDVALRRGISAGTVRFLQKPFDMATLARELRAALDNAPALSDR